MSFDFYFIIKLFISYRVALFDRDQHTPAVRTVYHGRESYGALGRLGSGLGKEKVIIISEAPQRTLAAEAGNLPCILQQDLGLEGMTTCCEAL